MNRSPVTFTLLFIVALAAACGALAGGAAVFLAVRESITPSPISTSIASTNTLPSVPTSTIIVPTPTIAVPTPTIASPTPIVIVPTPTISEPNNDLFLETKLSRLLLQSQRQ